jgi:hypothetical protein
MNVHKMSHYDPQNMTDFILNASLGELCDWLTKNPLLLVKNFDLLKNRISSMKIWVTHRNGEPEYCTMSDVDAFFMTILSRTSFTKYEYDLLNIFVNKVLTKVMNDGSDCGAYNDMTLLHKAVATSLMNKFDVVTGTPFAWGETYHGVLDTFYQTILDIYAPVEDPVEFIYTFNDADSFDQIVRNAGNTEYIIKKLKDISNTHYIQYKESILFFKILSDIYTNEDASFEYVNFLHYKIHTTYKLRDEMEILVDRYGRYFNKEDGDGDEASIFINDLFNAFTGDYDNITLEDYIQKILLDYSNKYKSTVNTQILKCLLNNIWKIVASHDHSDVHFDRATYVSKRILEDWGSSKYNVDDPIKEEEPLSPEDTPITTLESYTAIALEAVHKDSVAMNDAEKKIYKAYRTYKDAEEKVDSQITKAVSGMKNAVLGTTDARTEIIEGKKFSAIGLLKQVLNTVGLFSMGPVKGCIGLVVQYALKKKTTDAERKKILMELDTEIDMLTEKIEDARGDGNREAKYSMMRTKKELENARERIKYGMEADEKTISKAKSFITTGKIEGGY